MGYGSKAITALILLMSISASLDAQTPEPRTVRLMFYNVENFFDIYDDSLTDDNSFLPHGVMRWNYKRYEAKLNSLYKTIIAAGDWYPPPVIAFCEIESRKVLRDLIYGTYLSKFDYGIIHEDSPDRRGIDVCMIYRKEIVRPVCYNYWIPEPSMGNSFSSRSVLCVKLALNSDTVHLIVNHWPSRRGGVLASESIRMQIAAMIREKIDSIRLNNQAAKIIFMGDFNCTPDDELIRSLLSSPGRDNTIVNLSDSLPAGVPGTYRYMGTWEMIDQVLVSKNLICTKGAVYTGKKMLKIMNPDFLLHKDPKYPGLSPFSTYRGYRYQGGYSDHLPVVLDLGFR